MLDILGQRCVKEVKVPAYLFHHRLQAPRAHQLDLRLEVPLDANLPFQQLCRGSDFQRLDLLDLLRMKIDSARGIALPHAPFAERLVPYLNRMSIAKKCVNGQGPAGYSWLSLCDPWVLALQASHHPPSREKHGHVASL